jgi:hypothetical protein
MTFPQRSDLPSRKRSMGHPLEMMGSLQGAEPHVGE